jgi:Ca2+-binding EF-hand superfamily protein
MADKCTATKAQLKECFDKFDENKDGTATYHEIKKCLMDTCGMEDDEADGVLEEFINKQGLDKDGDKKVTFEEFVEAFGKADH